MYHYIYAQYYFCRVFERYGTACMSFLPIPFLLIRHCRLLIVALGSGIFRILVLSIDRDEQLLKPSSCSLQYTALKVLTFPHSHSLPDKTSRAEDNKRAQKQKTKAKSSKTKKSQKSKKYVFDCNQVATSKNAQLKMNKMTKWQVRVSTVC